MDDEELEQLKLDVLAALLTTGLRNQEFGDLINTIDAYCERRIYLGIASQGRRDGNLRRAMDDWS